MTTCEEVNEVFMHDQGPIHMDQDAWWFFCGDEGSFVLWGPHRSERQTHLNIWNGQCEHNHVVFRCTLRQMMSRRTPNELDFMPMVESYNLPPEFVSWMTGGAR